MHIGGTARMGRIGRRYLRARDFFPQRHQGAKKIYLPPSPYASSTGSLSLQGKGVKSIGGR